MIDIKNESKIKINNLNLNNFYVIADFDQTITTKTSNTTLSLYSKSGLYPKTYLEERNANYNYYRPLEIDPKITDQEKYLLEEEWANKSYNLMLKYKVRESDINKILNMENALTLRKDFDKFVTSLYENNIPLIISSAGCGNFIEGLLKKNNCYYENIYIHSNMFKFVNDVIVDNNIHILHAMNKNEINLPNEFFKKINNKKYAIIIGDQTSDIYMAKNLPKEDIISFGFLESKVEENDALYHEKFDVVLKETGFGEINKILKLEK